jgi:hypothetical protein
MRFATETSLGEKRVDERLAMVVDPALPEQFVANRVDQQAPFATPGKRSANCSGSACARTRTFVLSQRCGRCATSRIDLIR